MRDYAVRACVREEACKGGSKRSRHEFSVNSPKIPFWGPSRRRKRFPKGLFRVQKCHYEGHSLPPHLRPFLPRAEVPFRLLNQCVHLDTSGARTPAKK